MEDCKIMSMESQTNNLRNALVFALISIIFLIPGVIMFFVLFIQQTRYSDMVPTVLFTVALLWVGFDLLAIAGEYFVKHGKAKSTYLTVSTSCVSGLVNGKEFRIENNTLVSTSIQRCSLRVDANGVPYNLSPSFFSKLYNNTNVYLCIYTSTGRTYYIDSLLSPEAAKNTIDSIIMSNALNR